MPLHELPKTAPGSLVCYADVLASFVSPAMTRISRENRGKSSQRILRPSRRETGRGSSASIEKNPAQRTALVLAFLLALLTIGVYSSVGTHPFVNYDDPAYVVENSHVQAGWTWQTIKWAFSSTEASNWHPITWLSHALDCQFYGLNPAGHHGTNVLIHGLNVLLLFLLLTKATQDLGRSAMVAALFAIHPLNVETVAWISERKSVLSTLLLFLTLAAYGWYARNPNWKRYVLVVALFALGLMAKPMLITLPFALLLIDFWPLRRIAGIASRDSHSSAVAWSQLILEKLPLIALSAASAVITVIAQRGSLAPADRFPLPLRLENAIHSCAMYLAKAVWPAGLALFYPYPRGFSAWPLGVAALLLVIISAVAMKQATRRPYLLAGWCWFLGTLVPVLGIVQAGAQAMADRYAYVPLIGVFVAIVWSIRLPLGPTVQAALAVAVLLALSVVSWRQIGFWKTDYDLWSHTLAVTGDNLVAEDKLGVALQAMGKQDEAIKHFANALRLNASDPLSNFSVGADLQWHGKLSEAIPYYETAIQNSSDLRLRADAQQNLGSDYMQLGNVAQARNQFLLALQTNPQLVTAFAGLGQLAGEPARSISDSVVQHPTGEGYLELGQVFEKNGLFPEARLAYVQALAMNPGLADAQRQLNALSTRK